MRICHEQIYRALRLQGAGCLRQQLRVDKALRSGRTWRLPRLVLNGQTPTEKLNDIINGANTT